MASTVSYGDVSRIWVVIRRDNGLANGCNDNVPSFAKNSQKSSIQAIDYQTLLPNKNQDVSYGGEDGRWRMENGGWRPNQLRFGFGSFRPECTGFFRLSSKPSTQS